MNHVVAGARRALMLSLVAMLLALSTSCTAGSGTDVTVVEEDIPLVEATRDLVLPLDSYMYTADGYRSFLRARNLMVDYCLRRFGVDPAGPVWPHDEGFHLEWQNYGRYGRIDLESAHERGYQVPPWRDPAQALDHSYLWAPEDDGVWFILVGSTPTFADRPLPTDRDGNPLPEDGCEGEALGYLTGGETNEHLDLPEQLANEAYHLAESHHLVQEAQAAWVSCMDDRGYSYTSPGEPARDWPEQLTDEEIATAVADMECRIETNLVGIWYAVESAYHEAAIENHAEELAELQGWLDAMYRRSAEVLADQ